MMTTNEKPLSDAAALRAHIARIDSLLASPMSSSVPLANALRATRAKLVAKLAAQK